MDKIDQKILIVDDNPKNVQLLAKLLSDNHYSIETALSGTEALIWIEEEEFDIILLDIMMPEMDGYEVCERIKKDEENIDLPIIFLTAKTDMESLTTAFSKGGYDYLTKPFNSEELLARVKTHIELKRAKHQLKQLNNSLEEKVAERTKELKKSNDELVLAKVELEELDTAKSEFLDLISHEIRTPLNGVMGGLELLKYSELPEETTEFVNLLDRSVGRLESFSLMALNISELRTKGSKKINLKQVFLSPLINDIIDENRIKIEEKDLKFSNLEIPDHIWFSGDPNFAKKCINNIFDNAIKYSPQSGLIKLSTANNDNDVELTIEDEGSGFSEKILNNSFQLFGTVQDPTDLNRGLGLNLAKLIMDAHSGKISITNRPEGGAMVSLVFNK